MIEERTNIREELEDRIQELQQQIKKANEKYVTLNDELKRSAAELI